MDMTEMLPLPVFAVSVRVNEELFDSGQFAVTFGALSGRSTGLWLAGHKAAISG